MEYSINWLADMTLGFCHDHDHPIPFSPFQETHIPCLCSEMLGYGWCLPSSWAFFSGEFSSVLNKALDVRKFGECSHATFSVFIRKKQCAKKNTQFCQTSNNETIPKREHFFSWGRDVSWRHCEPPKKGSLKTPPWKNDRKTP